MNLNKYTAIKLARTLADKVDLTVVLEEELMPRTDGKTIYIQNPRDGWNKDQWATWWGTLYHEIGHNVPEMRDCFTLIHDKKIDMSSFFGVGINIIDDNRQEYYGWDEYAGRRSALSRSQAIAVDRILAGGSLGNGEDKYREAIESLLCWDGYQRQEWMSGLLGQSDAMYEQLTAQSQEWVDVLRSRSDLVLKDNITAIDEYNMLQEIIDNVFKFNSEEEEQKARDAYEKKHGKGDGEESEGASGKGKGKSTSNGEGEESTTSGGEVKFSDLLKHEHGDSIETSGYEPLKIIYDVDDSHLTFNSQPVKVIDYTKGDSRGRSGGYKHMIADAVSHSGSLSSTVRRLLQIRSKDRHEYGKKKGKLHGRNLYRVGMKGGISERVFKQKRENDCLDVSFTVLGDASGSMMGTKYTNMAASMIMLHDAVQPLGIPFELLAFTDDKTSEMSVFKTFTSKTNTAKLLDDLDDCGSRLYQNADGEAILWAYHRLVAQRTKRKVLVVLSDGSPASYRSGEDNHTRQVVKEIQKRGEVEIYGIGIEDDNVSRIYKDWKVINNSNELETTLLELIKTKIIN